MRSDLQVQPPRPSLLRRALALVVLIAVAALAFHVVIGLVLGVVWLALGLAAVVAVLWALKVLFW